MKNEVFEINIDKKTGGIKRLSLIGDPAKMNFCKKGRTLGSLQVRFYSKTQIRGFEVQSISKSADSVKVYATYRGLTLETEYRFAGERLVVQQVLKNENSHPVYVRDNDLGVNMPFNDRYENSKICMKERCSAHIFAGLDSSYIRAERMGDSPYNVGLVLTKGQFLSYEQEEVWHSNRGYFVLNTPAFTLLGGESYTLCYELFAYTDYADFEEKIKAYESHLHVEAPSGFTYKRGEEISFCVQAKNAVQSAKCSLDGKEIACDIDKNLVNIHFIAEKFGENKVYFEIDGKQSHATFNVTVDEETLIKNCLDFIVEKQQCNDERSPLYGAFLIYDNEEQRQYYNADRRDYNACRERFGMAILLAKWLQSHDDPYFRESLDKFTLFLLRESVDEETGEVFDGIGKNPNFLRLYNAPWVALFFTELYYLTKELRYARLVARVLKYYYSVGGAKFYPNGIRFYEFFKVLEDAGLEKEKQEVLVHFDEHVANIVKNGVVYPPHEVKFEQTIVTPAVTIMLDKYQISGDEFYLREAEKHLKILRKFDGCQPDHRLHNIPIRFWDDYWFGKRGAYGDTFPHYWSVLSGYCYYTYGKLAKNAEAVAVGTECIRNCTCLFKEDGSASCAYVYPSAVNGTKGEFFDVFANDQDFALYFLWKIKDEA